ncbi:glyoxalase [Agromyces italicus]|uniref:glyoxalase n=1 Tax=Agromyces italicus TaxID=279572 RepID=UPI00040ECAC8|nr:glyoxalase [Agromyces italicus]
MSTIESITLEVNDPAAADRFYADAFGMTGQVRTSRAEAPTSGFRGYTLSLVVAQPGNVRALFDAAVAAGAAVLKPVAKSLWGVGGVVQAPDGAIWKFATSAKKDTAPISRAFERVVLLLGAEDVAASKRFYADHGFAVGKSLGSYVDFETPGSPIGLGLYKRRALAKDAGVPEEGGGSHRLVISSAGGAYTDPDGFAWAPAAQTAAA